MITSQRRTGIVILLDGRALAGLRQSQGWTQADMARELYVSRACVSLWEAEERVPSLPQIERIRAVFGDALDESGAVEVVR
jgi:transcriptional regulator with XRE-family HTH domain